MSQTIESDAMRKKETDRKNIAIEYFRLISMGKFKEGLRFFAPDCKTHNPYISGSMNDLTNAMIVVNEEDASKYPEAEFMVKHILADRDLVAVHTQLLNNKSTPNEGGLRQVHVFRFDGDQIVEYWDISQQVLPNMPNADGAF